MMFVDRVKITVQSGRGGSGCASFNRRTDHKTVPNGGDGGNGGRVIFIADSNAPNLATFRMNNRWVAPNGAKGGSVKKRGKNAEDLIIRVRPGTKIVDSQRNFLIRELDQEGDEIVVLEGGRGGSGNLGGKIATPGEEGSFLELELSLQISSDVFIVGLPNSGKSKILNQLTRANVSEEIYPFSTRVPQIGVWLFSDYERLTLCELPSIYKGSSEGRGLGADFLKHLKSAKTILYALDPVSEFAGSLEEGLAILKKEVENQGDELLNAPSAVLVNKMDLAEAKEKVKTDKLQCSDPVFYLSAETGEGLETLKDFLKQYCEAAS